MIQNPKSQRPQPLAAVAAALVAALLLAGPAAAGKSKTESQQLPYTSDFRLGDCAFATDDTVDGLGNPYFPLVPGHFLRLEGDGEVVELTVCDDDCDGGAYGVAGDGTRVVDGVTTRVVREMEWADGELVEVSWNYFARCTRNGGVFYFGEDVDIFTDEGVVHDGAWLAGGDNAAGLVMPGNFLIGSRYFQEIAPGVALDRADNTADDLTVDLEAFDPFFDCVEVTESSGLAASDKSLKVYCPGIGLVHDSGIDLVDYSTP